MMNVRLISLVLLTAGASSCIQSRKASDDPRPNILFVISDDQSYPYASAYGTAGIHTPAFDQVAQEGILFHNAFTAAPQCSPSRAAILTGRNIWQLEEAGTHSSYFPKKFTVFTRLLEQAGYAVGYTGKPWGPGNWKDAGWTRNPVGTEYNRHHLKPPDKYISSIDYSANFDEFLDTAGRDRPFFFWCGGHEPHRPYTPGAAVAAGTNPGEVFIPSFLPDDSVVSSDIADYAREIAWFDTHLAHMIDRLRKDGRLAHTLIVVTSDNGMPFPSAKANLLDYGTHVPLAISWPEKISGGQVSDDLVSLTDLAPTFLQLAGLPAATDMTGKSLAGRLLAEDPANAPRRAYVLTGRERHTHTRPDDLGYPARAIRTDEFLFILNLRPDRWPAGDPPARGQDGRIPAAAMPGYFDIDDPSPTKLLMLKERHRWPERFQEGFARRPAMQLFDIRQDPGCRIDLAGNPVFAAIRDSLYRQLTTLLTQQKDPRMLGYGDIFESYPRFGKMRDLPGFRKRGAYNPAFTLDSIPQIQP